VTQQYLADRRPARAAQAPQADDGLLCITDIRIFFKLGRTAAYELTHRPDFPAPVVVSPRCYRWWASEVRTFAIGMRREGARPRRSRNASHARVSQAAALSASTCRITGRVRVARTRKTT
jgi:predicted DNA-binding transcriptional regulator AlpA